MAKISRFGKNKKVTEVCSVTSEILRDCRPFGRHFDKLSVPLRALARLVSLSNDVLHQSDRFVEAERDIHVLNSSAASTLAEVVDNRRDLHDVFVAENLDAGVVCVVADRRVQASVEQHRSGFVRQDLHEL